MTQAQLAARIDGMLQAEVSRVECDRVTLPRRSRMEKIASALEMSLGELLARSGWAGAEASFDAQPLAQPLPGTDGLEAMTAPVQDPRPLAVLDVEITRLRTALERSHQLRAESVALWQRIHESKSQLLQ